MTSLEQRVKEKVEQLRRGFIEKPKPVEGEPLEAALTMLNDIFKAIERPKQWYAPDTWADFRRRVTGEPSALELAFRTSARERADLVANPGQRPPMDEVRKRFQESGKNDKYEVMR